MRFLRLRRPSPALVISCVALFVALSGTGYAVVNLPRSSVGTKHLKKNAVTSIKVRNGAITSLDVKNDALTGLDINESTLALDLVPNQGLILVSSAPTNWELGQTTAGTTIDYTNGEAVVSRSSAAGGEDVLLAPDLPHAIYGKRTALVGAEVCYDATNAGASIDNTFLRVRSYTATTSPTDAADITDAATRNDETCRLYTFPSPPVLGEEHAVTFLFGLDFSGAGEFRIGRATFILQGTGVPATAPS